MGVGNDDFPLAMSTWGDGMVHAKNRNAESEDDLSGWIEDSEWKELLQGSPEEDKMGGWKSLAETVVESGRLGSGNLHRKGRNFRPVEEAAILEQRTKGRALKDLPPVHGVDKPPPDRKETPHWHANSRTSVSRPTQQSTIESNGRTIRAPPSGNNAWTSTALTDTPFWEKKTIDRPDAPWDEPAATVSAPPSTRTVNPPLNPPIATSSAPTTAIPLSTIPVLETRPSLMAKHKKSYAMHPKRPAFMDQPLDLFQSVVSPTTIKTPPGFGLYAQSTREPRLPASPMPQTPTNPVLVKFSVNIDDHQPPATLSVRLYDDPIELTRAFAAQYSIYCEDTLYALCSLIQRHKAAMITSRYP